LLSLTKRAAFVLLPILVAAGLAGCAGEGGGFGFSGDRGASTPQPYPANYRAELLAFLHTYINNPVDVRDAQMAEPVQRTVAGRMRYVSCLRYNARDSDGSYHGSRDRAVVYVDGRLDRVVTENVNETCAGATYAPFPEMEKMTR
jgi:hypothetical protein